VSAELVKAGDPGLSRSSRVDGAAALAVPTIQGAQMVAALQAYKGLQNELDKAMPEQIMEVAGRGSEAPRRFRKKGYWRAVAVAFNLDVKLVSERREVTGVFKDGRENFGWVVIYEAVQANGRSETGDGACFAVEKAPRFKCPHPHPTTAWKTLHWPHNTCPDFDPDFSWRTLPSEATEHNVRGHAHTRAFNRAVSNLVGFGEVSAEEAGDDDLGGDHHGEAQQARQQPRAQGNASGQAPAPAAQGGQAGQPAGQPGASAAPAAGGATTVMDVAEKKGGTKDKEGNVKPWTKYTVTFADGRKASTFDTKLAEEAQALRKSGAQCTPEMVTEGQYTNLKGFLAPAIVHNAFEPAKSDEPVTGAEKVLTIRKVSTDKGDRFIIQTDKRQLVTENAEWATQMPAIRAAGHGIIPRFETLTSGTGTHVYKLTGFDVVEMQAQAGSLPLAGDGAAQ